MDTALGFQTGLELYAKEKWLAISTEFIWWKEIPGAINLQLLQWGARTYPPREQARAFIIFRINILWFDWEVYFVGGKDEEKVDI